MKNPLRRIFILCSTLFLVAAACRFRIPDTQSVVLSEKQTLILNEPLPGSMDDPYEIDIIMGAGSLEIEGGADSLLQGTVEYNVDDWKPEVERDDNRLEIRQGVERSVDITALDRVINDWQLVLGNVPVELRITAGAYDGQIDLSGVPVTYLDISDGAGDAEVVFNVPNPVEMDKLNYRTGASDVELAGLANANFRRMDFDGGAGAYTLDFSGELRQDGRVKINGGLGDFTIIVPEDTAAEIEFNGNLMNINTRGTWVVNDNIYATQGSGPLLEIEISIGLGSVTVVSE